MDSSPSEHHPAAAARSPPPPALLLSSADLQDIMPPSSRASHAPPLPTSGAAQTLGSVMVRGGISENPACQSPGLWRGNCFGPASGPGEGAGLAGRVWRQQGLGSGEQSCSGLAGFPFYTGAALRGSYGHHFPHLRGARLTCGSC